MMLKTLGRAFWGKKKEHFIEARRRLRTDFLARDAAEAEARRRDHEKLASDFQGEQIHRRAVLKKSKARDKERAEAERKAEHIKRKKKALRKAHGGD